MGEVAVGLRIALIRLRTELLTRITEVTAAMWSAWPGQWARHWR